VNTVYCSYATPSGHALVGARIYLPAEQLDDPDCRLAWGIGADVVFGTKPQLAQDLLADMITDETMPPWAAANEVYAPLGSTTDLLAGPRHQVRDARGARVPRGADDPGPRRMLRWP
jgi:hypothetical protein